MSKQRVDITPNERLAGTKGTSREPWVLGSPSPDIKAQATVRDADGWDVAHCFGEHATSNARLIAAAPQLREALREALSAMEAAYPNHRQRYNSDIPVVEHPAVTAARAALRAADGEE